MVFPVMSVLGITRGTLCRELQLHPGLSGPNLHIRQTKYAAGKLFRMGDASGHVFSTCLLLLFPSLVTPPQYYQLNINEN